MQSLAVTQVRKRTAEENVLIAVIFQAVYDLLYPLKKVRRRGENKDAPKFFTQQQLRDQRSARRFFQSGACAQMCDLISNFPDGKALAKRILALENEPDMIESFFHGRTELFKAAEQRGEL